MGAGLIREHVHQVADVDVAVVPAPAGGAAEEGTVVVTPPTEVDIAAALESTPNQPDAANPYATQADIEPYPLPTGDSGTTKRYWGNADPTDDPLHPEYTVNARDTWVQVVGADLFVEWVRNLANDAWLPRGLVVVDSESAVIAEVSLGSDGSVVIQSAVQSSPSASVNMGADGAVTIFSGGTTVSITDDSITLAADDGPSLSLNADGSVELSGAAILTMGADGSVSLNGNGVVNLLNLPTADPVAAGALWNDAGTVKVSAG